MKRNKILLAMATCVATLPSLAFNPPTMGWSTWNTFALNINEQLIKNQADALINTGLNEYGYKFINIDDGYWDGRGEDGKLRVNKKLFPSGMRPLVDYIHKKGLKAGIYSDAGDNSCASGNRKPELMNIGFAGHEEEDCKTYFIDWDFDFIKVDYCGGFHIGSDERTQYTKISNAIKNCGKKGVIFNVCRWAYPGTWVSGISDSWRTTEDILCNWESLRSLVKENLYIQAYTGGGHYNDADMLQIGRTLSHDEENTHMAYWCITSSPLLIGCDMTTIPEHSLNLLKNKDLIAMNQDKLGLGAPVVQREGDVYVVAKDMEKLMGPKRAVVVMNLSDESKKIHVSLEAIGFEGQAKVYDCLTHQDKGKAMGTIEVSIPAHGSCAYFVTGKRTEKHLYQAEEAYLNAYQELDLNNKNTPMWTLNDTADQGAYVISLGKSEENYLEWPNVYSKKGGIYTLSIGYATGDNRNLILSVNGGQTKYFYNLNSGDYHNKWKEVNVKVKLKKGFNKIRLSNPSQWMPNIDYMKVKQG